MKNIGQERLKLLIAPGVVSDWGKLILSNPVRVNLGAIFFLENNWVTHAL